MATWKHACTALLLVISSCGKPPRLADYDVNADYLTEIFPAPVVVVAVIDSDNLVRKPIPSRRTPGLLLQLRRVDVRVENVLRGSVPKDMTTIYYFAWNEFSGGNIPLGAWKSGDRRIFWLRQDAAVLRTACDARDRTMPVYNGAHPQYEANQHKALGYALAAI